MKVVMIITGLNCGGAETILYELVKELKKYDFNLYIISLLGKGVMYEKIKGLGIPVDVISEKSRFFLIFSFVKLYFLLKNLKPDIVHTWMYHADLFGGLISKLANVNRIIWSVHNTNLDKDKTKFLTRVIVKMCSVTSSWLTDHIISCSVRSSLSHIEIGYPEKKITVIPNGFDLSKYCPKPESRQLVLSELNIPNDVFLVGLMARFDPVKNHIGFIRAASVLYKKNSKVHFILSGFGVDWDNEELVTIIDSLGLNSVIHMLGYRDDMPHLISSLDLFVSSSHGEAFPLVVGEAMSCEVPCVVTDVGDSAYLVGSTGKVVKPDDMHSLANAMEEILQMESKDRKYLGVKARRRIMENFNIEAVTKKYKNFYENVVTKGI